MGKIKIITDSTCDLPKELVNKYNIEVVPLGVTVDNITYLDGVDINLQEFLEKMDNAEEPPKTSQVNPGKFSEVYKKYLEEDYEIISIHLSSKMSGTFQSACIAKEMLESEKIHLIDSRNVTCGLGILVLKAFKLKNEGYEAKAICEAIENTIPHIKSTLNFESLDNLVKGGRISKTQGLIGGLLGIKLNLAVENGEMVVRDKVRGSKKALKNIIEYIDNCGFQNLNGYQALAYARIRKIDTIYKRDERQRKILTNIAYKLSNTPITEYPAIIKNIVKNIDINISLDKITKLAFLSHELGSYEIKQLQFPLEQYRQEDRINGDGMYVVKWKEEENLKILHEFIYRK